MVTRRKNSFRWFLLGGLIGSVASFLMRQGKKFDETSSKIRNIAMRFISKMKRK